MGLSVWRETSKKLTVYRVCYTPIETLMKGFPILSKTVHKRVRTWTSGRSIPVQNFINYFITVVQDRYTWTIQSKKTTIATTRLSKPFRSNFCSDFITFLPTLRFFIS